MLVYFRVVTVRKCKHTGLNCVETSAIPHVLVYILVVSYTIIKSISFVINFGRKGEIDDASQK